MSSAKQFLNLDEAGLLRSKKSKPLNILMLGDDRHPACVVTDYINSIKNNSKNNVFLINPIYDSVSIFFRLIYIDVILIHYSIYILSDYYLPQQWRDLIKLFPGCKIQIIQDEHRSINAMKNMMNELGISLIFSSLSLLNARKVYGDSNLTVISCLPGYIPSYYLKISSPPISDRLLDIVYRGRALSPILGDHAQDKQKIGEQLKLAALQHGLNVDISSNEDDRFYGNEWLRFLQSGRATLGVEGGASIFDFDGSLNRQASAIHDNNPEISSLKSIKSKIAFFEGNVVHRTITPRIFDAIAVKTALILYSGSYSGILEPGRHYIELKRDNSNIDSVIEKLNDHRAIQEMVDLTYDEIITQDRLSFRYFVKMIDLVIFRTYEDHITNNNNILQIRKLLLYNAAVKLYSLYIDKVKTKILTINVRTRLSIWWEGFMRNDK